MHFEILVEDLSGKKALENIIPKIIGGEHTFKIHPYKGIGRIPKDLKGSTDPAKRILLNELPRLLRGYGLTFAGYPKTSPSAVIVVCDLDNRCMKEFRAELYDIVNGLIQKPVTRFCLAVEEGEAWFLGDIPAIKMAFPKAKDHHLNGYVNDSICDTWEVLANALYVGGAQALASKGWQAVGAEKSLWSEKISPHMNIEKNNSPSFSYFRDTMRALIDEIG